MTPTATLTLALTLPNSAANDFPCGLGRVWFERPRIVFEKGAAGAWDDYGVRDPCLLADENGRLVREAAGELVMYYTGARSPDGMCQAIGRVVSFDDGRSWRREPEGPVVAPRPGAWDALMATTAWVLRDRDGIYRMFYRGLSRFMEDEGLGIAESTDGVHFQCIGNGPVFDRRLFSGIPQSGPVAIGVYNVVRFLDDRYLLTCEANAIECDGKAAIFAAVSNDGRNFEPFNGGRPIFTPAHVKSWSVHRVANPRLTVLRDQGLYLLAFNAYRESGNYAIGLAVSRDLLTWTDFPGNPVIAPSNTPIDDPFSGRIEGAVLVKEDLEGPKDEPVRCFVMGIPQRGPSMCGGAIGLSHGRRDRAVRAFAFRTVAFEPENASVEPAGGDEPETLVLRRGDESPFETRAHFTLPEQARGVSLRFQADDEAFEIVIALAQEPDALDRSVGLQVKVAGGSLAWRQYRGVSEPGPTLRERLLIPLGLGMFVAPREAWRPIAAIPSEGWLDVDIRWRDGTWRLSSTSLETPVVLSTVPLERVNDLGFYVMAGSFKVQPPRIYM